MVSHRQQHHRPQPVTEQQNESRAAAESLHLDSVHVDMTQQHDSQPVVITDVHLHKHGGPGMIPLPPGDDQGPPPSCSRKLRKYSFLILVNKYILYAVNCIIWLGGLFLVAFGVWARVEDSTVGYLQLLPFDPVALLIALGSLSVVISFFGCVGSIRENVFLLKIFCGAIGCLFIVELASCVVGFISVNSIKDAVIQKFYSSMELYDDDDQIRGLVDRIQNDYQCCGAVGPQDWDRNAYYNCSSSLQFGAGAGSLPGSLAAPKPTINRATAIGTGSNTQHMMIGLGLINALPSACGVPSSCCRSSPIIMQPAQAASGAKSTGLSAGNPVASFPGFPINDQCGFGIRRLTPSEQSSEIFIAGCADHMTESLSQNLLYVAVVALAISCFELISILLAFMLIRRITTVIEFMAYISSGRFIEVDPTRLAVAQAAAAAHRRGRRSRQHRSAHANGSAVNNNNNTRMSLSSSPRSAAVQLQSQQNPALVTISNELSASNSTSISSQQENQQQQQDLIVQKRISGKPPLNTPARDGKPGQHNHKTPTRSNQKPQQRTKSSSSIANQNSSGRKNSSASRSLNQVLQENQQQSNNHQSRRSSVQSDFQEAPPPSVVNMAPLPAVENLHDIHI